MIITGYGNYSSFGQYPPFQLVRSQEFQYEVPPTADQTVDETITRNAVEDRAVEAQALINAEQERNAEPPPGVQLPPPMELPPPIEIPSPIESKIAISKAAKEEFVTSEPIVEPGYELPEKPYRQTIDEDSTAKKVLPIAVAAAAALFLTKLL